MPMQIKHPTLPVEAKYFFVGDLIEDGHSCCNNSMRSR
jgi:hypothetical protein